MGNEIDITASEDNIQNTFSRKNRFTVPDYQRPYSWKKEQWTDFWNDLTTLPDEETHFLGSLVVIKHETGWKSLNELEIVDGQQRLTTISLILCAMRERYEEAGDPNDLADLIEGEYLYETDHDNNSHAKLSLSRFDDDNYNKILNRRLNAVDEDSRLLEGYEYFKKELDNYNIGGIDDLRKKLVGSMTVVIVQCESAGSAFRLFETLNDRGMELSAVDLMKNSLLQTAADKNPDSDRSDEYQHIREQWEYLLENVVHEISHPDRFFRHFMMSRSEPDIQENISSRTLYDTFKNTIETRIPNSNITLIGYIDEMVDVSNLYIGIVQNSIDEFSGRPQTKINSKIRNLNDIQSSHARTLVLRSFDEFDDSSTILELLNMIEVFMTRWRVADLQTGANLDKIFSDLCSNAFSEDNPLNVIRERLKEEAPSDDEFRAKLANSNFKRNDQTRYILDTIERRHFMTGGGGKTYDRASVDIEHIAPQSALTAKKYRPWKEILDIGEAEYNSQYRNRIGNLTLLEERLNEEASDNPFQQKKDQYRLSDFKMTEDIRGKYDEWNIETINERSHDLAEIGVEVWSFN